MFYAVEWVSDTRRKLHRYREDGATTRCGKWMLARTTESGPTDASCVACDNEKEAA